MKPFEASIEEKSMMATTQTRLVAHAFRILLIEALTFYSRGACRFPVLTAVLALCYHALIVALCSYLPQDLMAIGYGVAGYATAGCAVSLLGLYGTITVSAHHIETTRNSD
jgi:hypothetical protein